MIINLSYFSLYLTAQVLCKIDIPSEAEELLISKVPGNLRYDEICKNVELHFTTNGHYLFSYKVCMQPTTDTHSIHNTKCNNLRVRGTKYNNINYLMSNFMLA